MSNPYRKSVIEKMSSPEQLDKMVVITPPTFWIAIIAGEIIVIIALLWAIFGGIPDKLDTSGVYVSNSGSCSICSEVNNIVNDVVVESGDQVKKGDTLYTLKTETMKAEKKKLQKKLDQVNSVTLSSTNDPKTTETQNLISIKSQARASGVNTAAAAYEVAKEETEKAKESWQKKVKAAEKKKAAYENAINQYGEASPQALQAGTEYQAAMSESTTAESVYQSSKASLSSYKASSASGAAGAYATAETYRVQFEAAKGAMVSDLKSQISEYKKLIKDSKVKAPISGKIANVNIAEGSAVGEGTPTMVIHRNGGKGTCACYVSLTEVKRVHEGMEVNIYPSNYDGQEYGHIVGKVTKVDSASSTEAEISEKTGDPALAQAILSSGPVVAVSCEMIADSKTVSGYKWSTKKGQELEIDEGTYITAEIIIERKKPITMLIPYLQKKLENVGASNNGKNGGSLTNE